MTEREKLDSVKKQLIEEHEGKQDLRTIIMEKTSNKINEIVIELQDLRTKIGFPNSRVKNFDTFGKSKKNTKLRERFNKLQTEKGILVKNQRVMKSNIRLANNQFIADNERLDIEIRKISKIFKNKKIKIPNIKLPILKKKQQVKPVVVKRRLRRKSKIIAENLEKEEAKAEAKVKAKRKVSFAEEPAKPIRKSKRIAKAKAKAKAKVKGEAKPIRKSKRIAAKAKAKAKRKVSFAESTKF